MPFDPSQPFTVVDDAPQSKFDPSKPFQLLDSKSPAEKLNAPGALETIGEHAAIGVAPGAAFAAAAPTGAKAGAALGAMIPGLDATGIPEIAGGIIGALVTGGIASWAAFKAQHKILEKTAPKFTEEMDKRLAAGADEHPFAAIVGDVAGNLPSMEMEAPKLAQLPFRAALGATTGAVIPLAQGRTPTKTDIAEGALMGAFLGKSRFEGAESSPSERLRAAQDVADLPNTTVKINGKTVKPSAKVQPPIEPPPPEVASVVEPPKPSSEAVPPAVVPPKEEVVPKPDTIVPPKADVAPIEPPKAGEAVPSPATNEGGVKKFPQAPTPERFDTVEDVLKFKQQRMDEEKAIYKQEIGLTDVEAEKLSAIMARDGSTEKFEKQIGPEKAAKLNAFFDGPYNQRSNPSSFEFWEHDKRYQPEELQHEDDKPHLATMLINAVQKGLDPSAINDRFLYAAIAAKRLKALGATKSDLARALDSYTTRNSSSQGDKVEFFKSTGAKLNQFLASQGVDLPTGDLQTKVGSKVESAAPQLTPSAPEAKGKVEKPADIPPVAESKMQAWVDQAPKAPVAKTPIESINTEPKVKVTAPDGATMVRGTTKNGKSAVRPIGEFRKFNPFHGADMVKLEAGTMDKKGVFRPIDGDVKVESIAAKDPVDNGGGLQMAFVPGAKEFVEQDVIPSLKFAARHVAESVGELNAALRAPNLSDESGRTAGIVRQNTAELAQKDIRARAALDDAKKMFDGAGTTFSLRFIDNMENGRGQSTPDLDKLSTQLRRELDKRVEQVRALGTGKLEKLIENYFPHLWEQEAPARSLYSIIFGKRPLEGSKAFLKRRTIPTTKEGIDAGLKPVSTNPVELTLLKLHEIDRYVMAHKILNEMKDVGLAKFVKATEIAPEGYTKINDRIAEVYEGKTEQGSLAKRGTYYAPDDAARVLNNYLSPGLRKFALFRGAIYLSNALNQAELGLSLYHARFTTIDAATSKLALALERASIGDTSGAWKGVGISATAPIGGPGVESLIRGSKVLKEYTKPGSQGGDFARIVDALVKGGGRVTMDKFYKNSSVDSFWKAGRAGNYPGALLRAPFAALEAASKPTMEVMVPRMKLGIFADMASKEMERNPNMTIEKQREVFGKIWDSVDNRMGQMVYDNLFWNKALKDIAMLGTRSLGWNLGTVRELGGGLKDTATIMARLKRGDPAVTHRMAYLVALPMMVGTLGAIYHYMHTGKAPEDLEDYFMPKTGQKLPDGSDERVMLPTYMKDIAPLAKAGKDFGTAGVISRAEQMAVNKTGPLMNTLIEMMRNSDFYGTQIANKDDPIMKIVGDELTFVASQFKPFTVSQYSHRVNDDAKTKYETLTGIMPTAKQLTRSKSMQIISDYNQKFGGTRTRDEAELFEQRKDILNKIRTGNPQGEKDLDALVSSGKLTDKQADMLYKAAESEDDPRLITFKRLPLSIAEEAFKSATPEEKELWQDALDAKRDKYGQSD